MYAKDNIHTILNYEIIHQSIVNLFYFIQKYASELCSKTSSIQVFPKWREAKLHAHLKQLTL
jgi:hypothetical protein